jgi:predicted membrane GTPase involved in stress response
VVNKIDRPDARADEVLNEVFDLFRRAPTPTTSSSTSRASTPRAAPATPAPTRDRCSGDLVELFESSSATCPSRGSTPTGEFTMIATLLDRDPFLGRILTGRIESGQARGGRYRNCNRRARANVAATGSRSASRQPTHGPCEYPPLMRITHQSRSSTTSISAS